MLPIIATSSPALAQAEPVAGAVTGPVQSAGVNERFGQHEGLPIPLPPILRQTRADLSQEKRTQMRNSDPGQNQKALVVHQASEPPTPLLRSPTQERVAPRDLPSRRAQARAGHGSLLPEGHRAQRRSGRLPVTQIMISGQEVSQERALSGPFHNHDLEGPTQLFQGKRNRIARNLGSWNLVLRARPPGRMKSRGQWKEVSTLQWPKQIPAGDFALGPIGLAPVPQATPPA
mgnify:FL=1